MTTRKTSTTRTTAKRKTTEMKDMRTASTTAAEEGLLDARLLELDPARWPTALRVRYVGDQPVSGPAEVVDLLTVDEVDR